MKDRRRLKDDPLNANLHFVDDEKRRWPKKRSYSEYVANAQEAKLTGLPVNGVLGVWPLGILPYAEYIHWIVDVVHTDNNVVENSLNSLRPSYGGSKTTSKKTR
jgi:hypothetical protein